MGVANDEEFFVKPPEGSGSEVDLPQILRAAAGAGLDGQLAEDVTQSTFLTFLETAHKFEGRSRVRTWLFGILYRKIAEARRKAGREQAMEDIDRARIKGCVKREATYLCAEI